MLKFYKTQGNVVKEIDKIESGCWVNMTKPTQSEVAWVIENLNIDGDFVRAALDPEETSRVEMEDEQTLIIVDVPVTDESADGQSDSYSTFPMGIIIAEENVITVSLNKTSITGDIISGKIKNIQTALKTRFLFQILLRVAGRFLTYLRRIERNFTKIERRLYQSLKNEELIELLRLSKSLVYFSASLKANEVTMEKVLRGRVLKLYEDDKDLLEDALIEVRQAIEMANIYSSILAGTMDAYASVVSNNLNMIMRVLTVITIVLTIPNIVFSFYGMNIANLPADVYWWVPAIIAIFAALIAWLILKKVKMY